MIQGIHHITAIASRGNDTHRFYTDILGLRLVKKSVNQDDPGTYHLFYGDTLGHPGMDLTFFLFQGAQQGTRGNGLVTTISLAVPEESLEFWMKRFTQKKVKHNPIHTHFGKKRIVFYDADDQQLELVGVPLNEREDDGVWITSEISKEHAIRSFYSATLSVPDRVLVEPILYHVFGYTQVAQEANLTRYQVTGSKRAQFLEVDADPARGLGWNAAGTVHHIAFRAHDAAEQTRLRNLVRDLGIDTTDVIDRYYFKSVYFRIPSGILFEIATDNPGFTADEKESELGSHLSLPPFLEPMRAIIEHQLPPLS